MKLKIAAKINLLLDVTGILPDGYHSLQMVMQSVDCCDEVTVLRTRSGKIEIESTDTRVPLDEKNIAFRAAVHFFEATGIQNTGVSIAIEKRIPMAAGLAGGSADGAGVLYALNTLFDAGLSIWELAQIGEKVGADVPFSLLGGTAVALDKGGVLAPLPALSEGWFVLCKPQQEVSTVGAYQLVDESYCLRHADTNAMIYAMRNQDYALMCQKAQNIFEQVIEVPERPQIKGTMRACGADLTLMSGSGPTVYGWFRSEKAAKRCVAQLQKEYKEVFLARPLPQGIEVLEP